MVDYPGMEVFQRLGGVYFYLPRLKKALWATSLLKIFDHCGTLAKLLDGSQYIHPPAHHKAISQK
jgi:hypothetical protein